MHLLVLFLVAQTSASASVSLRGTVEDEAGRPIEGAVVVVSPVMARLDEPLSSVTSDADGRFAIDAAGRPPFTVVAYRPGYGPFRANDVAFDSPLRAVLERAERRAPAGCWTATRTSPFPMRSSSPALSLQAAGSKNILVSASSKR